MTITPAPIDPPEITNTLWQGFVGGVGYDVGANVGQTIPRMLTRFQHVVAYEPSVECWPFLEQFPEIVLRKVAVTDRPGTVDLVELPDKIDTGQLVTQDMTGMEWSTEHPGAKLRTVEAVTLDEEAERHGVPDFLKVDVEGHEQQVLDGAKRLLAEAKPRWLIEFHAPELHVSCTQTLEAAGYTVETVRHPYYPVGSPYWYCHGWIRAFPIQ